MSSCVLSAPLGAERIKNIGERKFIYGEKIIIGLDKGQSENTAYLYRMGDKSAKPLSLGKNQISILPSAIAYDGTHPIGVGERAVQKSGMINYFKTPPHGWLDANGNPSQINGHKIQDMMEEEIRAIYRRILKYNKNAGINAGDEMFLYVGCPSDSAWIADNPRRQYQAMVCKATGLDSKHVHIVAESRAAIFNSFMGGHKQIKAKEGVAVFDFGASTADFTYICTGDLLLERSWTLGASEIEKNMLELLLREQKLSLNDICQEDLGILYLRLCEFKERHYSRKLSATDTMGIRPFLADQNNQRIPDGHSPAGEPKYKQVTLQIDGDCMGELMDAATGDIAFPISENGQIVGTYNWENGCERFMKSMCDRIKLHDHPCGYVILTGGASQMPFVEAFATRVFRAAYPDVKICMEATPSITVARGLCVVGKIDMELDAVTDQVIQNILKSAKSRLNKTVIKNSSAVLAKKAYDTVLNAIKEIDYDITLQGLQEEVDACLRKKLNEKAIKDVVRTKLKAWQTQNEEELKKEVNKAVEALYNDMLTSNAIVLQKCNFDAAVKHMKITGVSVDIFDLAISNIEIPVSSVIKDWFRLAVNVFLPGFGWFNQHRPQQVFDSNYVINAQQRTQIVAGFQAKQQKAERIEELKEDFAKQLKPKLNPQKLTQNLPKAVRSALEIAALKYFKTMDN